MTADGTPTGGERPWTVAQMVVLLGIVGAFSLALLVFTFALAFPLVLVGVVMLLMWLQERRKRRKG